MPAASVSEAVGDAARVAVEALALSGVTVTKRKTPSRPEGATTRLPEVVVSVGEEGLSVPFAPGLKRKTYPCQVTIITAGGKIAGDDATLRDWRQQIEDALQAKATWSDITGYLWAGITSKLPFDTEPLGKDFNVAAIVAEVQVIEART